MRLNRRAIVAMLLCESLILSTVGCGARRTVAPPQVTLAPVVFKPLQESLQKSYLELFGERPSLWANPCASHCLRFRSRSK